MIKPSEFIKWALNIAQETRLNGVNKVKPPEALENNGTLDGAAALNHFNWMFNNAGLWQQFLNDLVVVVDGQGIGLTKDNHSSFIFAHNKLTPSQFILGSAFKNGVSAPTVASISSSVLGFGTTLANGTIPITGAATNDVVAISFNFIK
jgi:hypothetical protein